MAVAPLGTKLGERREAILQANLEALARLGAHGLAKALADVSVDGELDEANGEVTGISLRTACGLVRLHGRRDQVAEALRWLPPGASEAPLLVVVGAGAGFVVDGLEQQGVPGRVLVLEPSVASLKAMLSRRGWCALLEANRLRVLVGPEYTGWLDLWNWVGETTETPPVVVHPVLVRERPADIRQAVEVLDRLLFNANANAEARRRFAGPYLLNTLSNLRHLVASRDVAELFGRFSGVPACVLGAGPSLNRNLEQLRPHRDGALVLAVDTALRPCLAAGIEPDLVVAVDPGEANLRHLSIGGAPARTHLVAEPSVAPGSFDAFGGRAFTFRVAEHHPWPWLRERGIDRAKLLAWGSVLTTTLDLAAKLGCSPLVLLGADFAYTDGQPYCRGTVFEEDWAREVAAGARLDDVWRRWRREPVVVERGIDGRDVETSTHLRAFRDWVVEFSGKSGSPVLCNRTRAGILSLPDVEVPFGLRRPDIPVERCDRERRRAARRTACDLASAAKRDIRRGRTAATESLTRAVDERIVSAVSLQGALAACSRMPMIKTLPDVPLAQHVEEFEQLLRWIDDLTDVRVLVEVGSRLGGSFYALAAHLGVPLTAVAIDLPGGPWGLPDSGESLQRVARRLRDEDVDAHVVLGDSHDAGTVDRLKAILAGRPIDVLFVDGDHSLAGVAGDLRRYAGLVRPGGLVALHDVAVAMGRDAVVHGAFPLETLQTLADVHAAFSSLARGRRSAMVTHQWGIGAVWM